jgi:uncharacterized protein YukE
VTTIAPVDDPRSYLTAPGAAPGAGMEIWSLRMQCGIIIGGVDAVIAAITGFSPLEEWVFKPLGGDWDALDKGAVAWTSAGKAAKAVSTNLHSLPGQIGDSWTGATADEFAKAQAKVASSIVPLPGACDSLSQMCTALAEMAKSIAEFVAQILSDLSAWALKMIVSAAVPVAGEVAMAGWLTELGVKIATWVPKLTGMVTKFIEFVTKIAPIVAKIAHVIEVIDTILEKLSSLMKIVSSGESAAAAATT